MKILIIIIIQLLSFQIINAQLPNTHVFSLDLLYNEQKVIVKEPKLLTAFNESGYNNQPHFISDNTLLITSNYKCLGLTDILQLDINKKEVERMTYTEESEYSPTVMPDGISFSVVRQELDDSQQVPQLLWTYPLDKSNFGRSAIEDIDNVGYHCWMSSSRVALFLVAEPSELVLYDTKLKTNTFIASNVGRCLKTNRSGLLYYTQKIGDVVMIKSYDMYLGQSKEVATSLDGNQDFDILPNGYIISSKGGKLFAMHPSTDVSWIEIIDLEPAGINKISRITHSAKRLAIVADY